MIYTATLTTKGQVTIPKVIRDYLGLSAQDQVAFVKSGNQVIVTHQPTLHDLAGSLPSKVSSKVAEKDSDSKYGKHVAEEYEKELRDSGY